MRPQIFVASLVSGIMNRVDSLSVLRGERVRCTCAWYLGPGDVFFNLGVRWWPGIELSKPNVEQFDKAMLYVLEHAVA